MRRKRGFESTKKITKYVNVANAQRKRWSSAQTDAIEQTDHSYVDLQLQEDEDDTTPAKAICLGMSYILETCKLSKRNCDFRIKASGAKKLTFLSKLICALHRTLICFVLCIHVVYQRNAHVFNHAVYWVFGSWIFTYEQRLKHLWCLMP